jgi:hypothetical protein
MLFYAQGNDTWAIAHTTIARHSVICAARFDSLRGHLTLDSAEQKADLPNLNTETALLPSSLGQLDSTSVFQFMHVHTPPPPAPHTQHDTATSSRFHEDLAVPCPPRINDTAASAAVSQPKRTEIWLGGQMPTDEVCGTVGHSRSAGMCFVTQWRPQLSEGVPTASLT